MPPTPDPAPLRSAAELNAAIRAFWIGPTGHPAVPLSAEQRAEYRKLCEELWAVEHGGVVEAA